MFKPNQTVDKVTILKDDNINDEGIEGYEVTVTIGEEEICQVIMFIEELDDMPRGIYNYDGEKYIQIENWDE